MRKRSALPSQFLCCDNRQNLVAVPARLPRSGRAPAVSPRKRPPGRRNLGGLESLGDRPCGGDLPKSNNRIEIDALIYIKPADAGKKGHQTRWPSLQRRPHSSQNATGYAVDRGQRGEAAGGSPALRRGRLHFTSSPRKVPGTVICLDFDLHRLPTEGTH